jgi:hypothetical protein
MRDDCATTCMLCAGGDDDWRGWWHAWWLCVHFCLYSPLSLRGRGDDMGSRSRSKRRRRSRTL